MFKKGMLVVLAGAMAVAGCDSDSPAAPTDPNLVIFTAQLSAANEVPTVTNAEITGRGNVRITFNLTRDGANNVTGATATFVVNLNSFPAGSTWTLAHIHEGVSGIAGPVRVNTGLSAATSIALPNGTVSNQTFSNIQVVTQGVSDPALVNAIISNPAGFYFNVHTLLNPPGAVRGQLVRQ